MSPKSKNKLVIGAAVLAASLMFGTVPGCAQEVPGPAGIPAEGSNPSALSDLPPLAPLAADAAAADPNAAPPRWPLVVESNGDQVVMYQPQLETFEGDKLTARAAVSVQKPGEEAPVFGVVWLESRVATDRAARTVQILDANITRARFPDAPQADEAALLDALRQRLAEHPKILALDTVLKMLEVVQQENAQAGDLQNTPPRIIFMRQPAVKVQFDGAPRLGPVAGSNLLRVINTPFFIGLDPAQKTYYLKGGGQWFGAADPLGPFRAGVQVPSAIAQLADQGGYQDPQQPLTPEQAAQIQIVTATEPSELIWTDGPEEMGTISGTELLYVTNTDSDVFLALGSQQLYVLLSGRWYTAKDRNGPWTFVAPGQLPADFARIPSNSPKGEVLAHVPGTPVAQDAVADTYIPQTATIDRTQVERPTVTYDGDPQFQPVEGVPCSYAVNTPYSVVQVNRRYYCCYQAAWYEAAASIGPWDICINVPHEVYLLPPSCPIYPVKYVYVYGYTPEAVYVGYTPGYVGCYPYDGCVVYGTGYSYRPWIGREHYYARPYTFGYAARYESYSGRWGFEVGRGAGGGQAWVSEGRDRAAPGGRWFGNGGYRPVTVNNTVINNYNNSTKNVNITRNVGNTRNVNINVNRQQLTDSNNLYERRKDVRRQTPVAPTARPGVHAQTNQLAKQASTATPRDNVFAAPNGNVYRKTLDGWETRQGNTWVPQKGQAQRAVPWKAVPHDTPAPAPHETPHPAPREKPAPIPRETAKQLAPHESQPQAPRPPQQKPVAVGSETSALDRDLRARVAGRDRYQNSPRSEPAPRPAPAPREPAARPAPTPRQPEARPEPPPRQPAARPEPGQSGHSNDGADAARQGGKK